MPLASHARWADRRDRPAHASSSAGRRPSTDDPRTPRLGFLAPHHRGLDPLPARKGSGRGERGDALIVELVVGARGRSLCLSELCGPSEEFAWTLQMIEREVEQHIGTDSPPVGSLDPAAPLVQALADAIAPIDLTPLRTTEDPLTLLAGLGAATDAAMPWQPPHVRDALAALPAITDALRPTGAAIHASPAAAWWSSPIALADQWEVAGEPYAQLRALRPARPALEQIRRDSLGYEALFKKRYTDPAKEPGGTWWSTPVVWMGSEGTVRPASSRRLASIGAMELAAQEDSYGPERAALRQLLPSDADIRVYEVHQPSDWQHLVATYPFDVSRSRRGVWWHSTGIDGAWFIPDWQAVAGDYDAVHVSVHGYLTTAGEAHPVPGGNTVLAGWNPDVTYWLCDVTGGTTEYWHRTSDNTMTLWARESA